MYTHNTHLHYVYRHIQTICLYAHAHTHTPIIGRGSLSGNCRTVRVSFVYTAPPGKETAGELSLGSAGMMPRKG